nr:FliH/SctL family protein [Motiliproteus sediminis]
MEEGRAAGRESGHQAAYSEAQAEIDDLKARLASLASQLQSPLARQHEALEAQMLQLVADIAQAVIGGELATRPELMREAVQRALDVLPQEGALSFSVHPDDESLLLELREREGAAWEVRTDAAMARGGLIARGANSYLDYQLDKRLAAVLAQLRQDRDETAAVKGDDPDDS